MHKENMETQRTKYDFYVIVKREDGSLIWVNLKTSSKKRALKIWQDLQEYQADGTDSWDWPPVYDICVVSDQPYIDPDGEKIAVFATLEEMEEATGAYCL